MNHVGRVLLFGVALVRPLPAQEVDRSAGGRLLDAVTGGDFGMSFRHRFELVNDDRLDLGALASTLRTALHYETQPLYGFTGYIEAEGITNIGAADKHNNLGAGDAGNGVTDRPVIADPPVINFNQVYLQWRNQYVTAKAGRHEINLDNQRFVGAVGWRQHHQTFLSARAIGTWRGFTVNYAFLDRAYRITGASLDMSSNLLNAKYDITGVGSVTGYAYLLDFTNQAPGLSTTTFGAEFGGNPAVGGEWKLRYRAEYATQGEAAQNPDQVRANYLHLVAGADYGTYGLRVGWERLSGSEEDGQFTTPLATLHAFNGWADKFLITPTNGISDLYARADGPLGPIGIVLVYHGFKPATGSGTYGSEFDFQLTYRASWRQLFGFRGARYVADEHSTSVTKIWLYTEWSF
jgi:hypothetical protein